MPNKITIEKTPLQLALELTEILSEDGPIVVGVPNILARVDFEIAFEERMDKIDSVAALAALPGLNPWRLQRSGGTWQIVRNAGNLCFIVQKEAFRVRAYTQLFRNGQLPCYELHLDEKGLRHSWIAERRDRAHFSTHEWLYYVCRWVVQLFDPEDLHRAAFPNESFGLMLDLSINLQHIASRFATMPGDEPRRQWARDVFETWRELDR